VRKGIKINKHYNIVIIEQKQGIHIPTHKRFLRGRGEDLHSSHWIHGKRGHFMNQFAFAPKKRGIKNVQNITYD